MTPEEYPSAAKTCSRCGETKPTSEFYRNRTYRDGLFSYCKACHSSASKAWAKANREADYAYRRQWVQTDRTANPEKYRQRHRRRYDAKGSTYRTWKAMWTRCINPKQPSWEWYGARGITVCERWKSYENFLADMGERPEGMTLDRIDPDGNYEPGNCRWATPKEQAANRRAA
jgi:hypothetical protein